MKLNIPNEYSELLKVCVCRGTYIPEYQDYAAVHPEFTKYCHKYWDKQLFLKQQEQLFEVFCKYDVALHFATPASELPWLAYTRDFGFVIADKLFYCASRKLPERNGEIEHILTDLQLDTEHQVIEITAGTIEGGDVLVDDEITYVGLGSRSSKQAVDQLRMYTKVKTLELGDQVMHLDTRMTILPDRKLLVYPPAFNDSDIRFLRERFDFVEVTKDECDSLATNVFVINPKTIIVDASHERVAEKLTALGFIVELIDYSEPIAISGSFRCTTFPLLRAGDK